MPRRPQQVVVADASPLIALRTVEALKLLRELYSSTLLTDVVRAEVIGPLPDWLEVSVDYDRERYAEYRRSDDLDPGEASALALAERIPEALLLVDERKARAVAVREGLAVTGALGVVITAKREGVIEAGLPLVDGMRSSGLWLAAALYAGVRERLGE